MKKGNFRYLVQAILEDLDHKMVLLSGPRQVGKTTLSKEIIGGKFSTYQYYNWDSLQDRKAILEEKWGPEPLLVLDEVHKYRSWKNHIKGIYDKLNQEKKIIVTGSAKLNIFRKGGDSLLGRYHAFRLHPFSVSELTQHTPALSPFTPLSFSQKNQSEAVHTLLSYGGFPEPLFSKNERTQRRWLKTRKELLLREDLRDLSRVEDLRQVQLLMDLLPQRVASLLSINSIREDLEVSHKAITSWLELLEALYYSYRIYPFQTKRVRALKKEPKLYLWDWSEVENPGAKFENMVAGHLLKTVHFLEDYEGYSAELFFLRDQEKREVDFLVTVDKKPWFSVEVKLSDPKIPPPLTYFKNKLDIPFNYVVTLEETKEYTQNGVTVLPASQFLTGLM